MCGIDTRICCTRLSQQVYGLIDMAKEKLAYTQSPIRGIDIRIVRTEPDRFLDVGDCCLWLAQIHQDEAELSKGPRVSVERCCCLELDPGFGQSVLNATKHSHRPVCHRVIRVPLEYFEEQEQRCEAERCETSLSLASAASARIGATLPHCQAVRIVIRHPFKPAPHLCSRTRSVEIAQG